MINDSKCGRSRRFVPRKVNDSLLGTFISQADFKAVLYLGICQRDSISYKLFIVLFIDTEINITFHGTKIKGLSHFCFVLFSDSGFLPALLDTEFLQVTAIFALYSFSVSFEISSIPNLSLMAISTRFNFPFLLITSRKNWYQSRFWAFR